MTPRDWAAAATKSVRAQGQDVDIVHLPCSLESYEEVWGAGGTEIGLMIRFFAKYPNAYGVDIGELPLVTPEDLGVAAQLRSTEDALREVGVDKLL